MVDRLFTEPSLAGLYDVLCTGRTDFDFYLPLVMSADSVLDVGCGTGELLHRAREAGHRGRLCGLDPAAAMLDQARARTDVEWILGDLTSAPRWDGEFELVIMTGHAFQVFVADVVLRHALAAIRAALTADGRFVFETRNPAAREWERWTRQNVTEVTDTGGAPVRSWSEAETPVTGDVVRFTQTVLSTHWDGPRTSRSTLRFLDAEAVSAFLAGAGLAVEELFGDWDRRRFTAADPEIIVVARPA